jgi:hypothetical protein
MKKIGDRLKKVAGVKEVEINERTGSILVEHDQRKDMLDQLDGAVLEAAADLFELAADGEGLPLSSLAAAVKTRLHSANSKVAEATDYSMDLRSAVPLALLGVSVVKLIQDKAWWNEVPAFQPTRADVHVTDENAGTDGNLIEPAKEDARSRRKGAK